MAKSCLATAPPVVPSFFGSQRIWSDGMRLESPSGCVTEVVTPSIAVTRRAIVSSHETHAFHSASWSRFIHISTAISIPMASSLPTFIPRAKP